MQPHLRRVCWHPQTVPLPLPQCHAQHGHTNAPRVQHVVVDAPFVEYTLRRKVSWLASRPKSRKATVVLNPTQHTHSRQGVSPSACVYSTCVACTATNRVVAVATYVRCTREANDLDSVTWTQQRSAQAEATVAHRLLVAVHDGAQELVYDVEQARPR